MDGIRAIHFPRIHLQEDKERKKNRRADMEGRLSLSMQIHIERLSKRKTDRARYKCVTERASSCAPVCSGLARAALSTPLWPKGSVHTAAAAWALCLLRVLCVDGTSKLRSMYFIYTSITYIYQRLICSNKPIVE